MYGLGETADDNASNYGVHVVKRHENLYRIAEKAYGDGNEYPRILKANLHKIDDPDRIYPGQLLRIPRRTEGENA